MNILQVDKRPAWAPKMLSGQRITALDLARFIAMIFMVQGHTIEALLSPNAVNFNEFPWDLWQFARGFTAQVFLIVSGTVHVFANKRMEDGFLKPETVKRRAKIALLLMGIGYMFMFPANKIWDLPFIDSSYWVSFLQVNILQLIGITLFFNLLLFKLTKTDKGLGSLALVLAIIISLLTPFVHLVHWFDFLPEIFAAYLSFEHGSIFPIFPYTAFMFYGIFLGTVLKRMPPENRSKFIIKWFSIIGIVLIVVGFGVRGLLQGESWILGTKVNPGAIMYQIGFVLLGMGICAFIYTKSVGLSFYYAMFGKRALMVYVLHLLVLYGTPWFESFGKIYANSLSAGAAITIAVFIEIITFGIVFFYEYFMNKYEKFRKYYLWVLGIIVGYLLAIGNIFNW